MKDFEPITTEDVRNVYVDRHGPDQEAYDEFDDWARRFKAEALREVLAWADEQHPWIGLMDLKEHIEERANEIEGKS